MNHTSTIATHTAIRHLRAGTPALAFIALVEATEAEARSDNPHLVIPASAGLRRLIDRTHRPQQESQ